MKTKPYTADSRRYDKMIYNRCGRSGLKLPAISLGLWHNFGDVDDFGAARQMILAAFDNGITHFDLANNYGPPPGSAETNFGKILKKDLAPYRDELIISTKAGYLMWPGPYGEWGSKKYLIASLEQSLKRMGLEYVDIFYSHRPDPDTPLEETMEALAQAVHQGKALYAGISNYSPQQTRRAAAVLAQMGIRLLIHQPPFSMLRRTFETAGLFETLEELGIGAICFSPLAQGLLTDKYLQGIPADSRAAKPHGYLKKESVTPDLIQKITQLNRLAQQRGQTLAQMALAWVLSRKTVTSALIGTSRLEQLLDNLKTLENLCFSEEQLRQIEAVLNA
ncbi:MAG TPA: L-glyceraldehyde 3-phosphate reductase [Anaerohalosphaeraceae bacterium]|nr:L-glyceraldehyde 3-phosphate reductase [Anaerohalosphaeraceae bacterium]HPO69337.1 L-glyceraldehyde 3-phosphate reductase [Anaerohalosphaeraceae bacterium]HRS72722.1 L-glyceraldehyde 3-phosphate reductase [Anaerohalosphaeraceae bacterium]HRV18957.1 L-glyceraldehyde 3-phosphate reductase [Anaerohalosphaeraceae bacterium]